MQIEILLNIKIVHSKTCLGEMRFGNLTGFLGVIRKLRHAKNDFFETHPPKVFQRKKNFVFGLSQILLPPPP